MFTFQMNVCLVQNDSRASSSETKAGISVRLPFFKVCVPGFGVRVSLIEARS